MLSIDARPAAMGVFYEVYGTYPTMYSEHLLSVGWAFIRISLAGLWAQCVLVLLIHIDLMVLSDPSWNTDQGVQQLCENNGDKIDRFVRSESESVRKPVMGCQYCGRRSGICHIKYTCWDPKDGELYPSKLKPEETLVEGCRDTDVQIVRLRWAKWRKTNRTI